MIEHLLQHALTWAMGNPDQVGAGLLSVLAVYLVAGRGGPWAKWGCIAGFLAQPCWFILGWRTGVYIVCAMSAAYGYSYAKGLHREWGMRGGRA